MSNSLQILMPAHNEGKNIKNHIITNQKLDENLENDSIISSAVFPSFVPFEKE